MFGWLRRWWRGKPKPGSIASSPTLARRIERSGDQEREILRLASESLRRGFPGEAEQAYEKAAQLYRANGVHRKEAAVLKALTRLRPDEAGPWVKLAECYLRLELRKDAAEALRKASVRFQKNSDPEAANDALRQARELEELPPPPQPVLTPPEVHASDEEVRSLVEEGLSLDEPPVVHAEAPSGEAPVDAVQTDRPASAPAPTGPLDLDLSEALAAASRSVDEGASPAGGASGSQPLPAEPSGPSRLPSARPDPSVPPSSRLRSNPAAPSNPSGPVRPRLSSIVDAQTEYDPEGSAALLEARRRLASEPGIRRDATEEEVPLVSSSELPSGDLDEPAEATRIQMRPPEMNAGRGHSVMDASTRSADLHEIRRMLEEVKKGEG
jgi:hypothetical protein